MDSLYFLWGILVLTVVMLWGYPTLLKYADKVLKVFLIGLWAFILLLFVPRLVDIDLVPHHFFSIYSPSVRYGVIQLSIPMAAVILYHSRRKGLRGIWLVFAYEAAMILFACLSYMSDTVYVPIVTMVISCTGIIIYMILKAYFSISKLKGVISTVAGTVLLATLFCAIQWNDVYANLQMFINPNASASVGTAWDDSYNNVLIQDLLSRAGLFGEVKLSEDERVSYLTSQWYYEEGAGNWNNGEEGYRSLKNHVEYKMQYADNLELEDILPQHYLNNYRIAYWILKYGIVSALVPVLLIIETQIAMFWVAFKIKNRLGRLTAVAGCFAFTIQNMFYFLGNFGFQFGKFGNLPFVSEGLVSITGTMVMAGLILSAYRFDTVVKEEK